MNLRAGPRNGAEVLAVVGAGAGGRVQRLGHDGGRPRVRHLDRFETADTGWGHATFLAGITGAPSRSNSVRPSS